jgi:dienelactone hydrolase
MRILPYLLSVCALLAQETRTESYLGNLAPVIHSIHQERGFPMAYANRQGLSTEAWRSRGRAELHRTLSYSPKAVPLDLKVHSVQKRAGFELRVISFAGAAHYRIPAYLLVPTQGTGPFPAAVALHDHGGWFVHGKEKLVTTPDEHAALKDFRAQYYGGRAYAEELARRGFVVIVPDAFYWGDRRLQYKEPPPDLQKRVASLDPASTEYVRAMNSYLRERNYELNTWLSFAGTSWMGIVAHDDRRSIDLLASLPEVDRTRIGCLGLSGGGYRATYLTGLDSRIKASVIVGWMTSLPTTLEIPYSVHAGLFDAFGAHANLDHPDIASLAAPDSAVFVQNCARDRLFTPSGMESATEKIRAVFAGEKRPERFKGQFYDVPHQFNAEMQDDAFVWLERWLGKAK